jgi:prepilin-type N-terminal cleavage/methylation domain-containing protein
MLKHFNKNKYTKGVTLIELLVVIAIIGIITVVTLADYRKYRSSMPTQNLADDIALSVRKTQGYAVGVKGDGASFNYGYGIYISADTNISNPSAGSNKAFIIFKDMNDDGKYTKDASTTCGTPTTANECLEILRINGLDTINGIEVLKGGSTTNANVVNIMFKRPNPEPTFCPKNNPSESVCFATSHLISRVSITVGNGNGSSKLIRVWKNGQISVD